jgi:ribosomal protein L37AE/L43A
MTFAPVEEEGYSWLYQCSKCGETDHDRTAHPPTVINCWNCGAGRGMDPAVMLQQRVGMLPAAPPEPAAAEGVN